MVQRMHAGTEAMLKAIREAGEHGLCLAHALRADTTSRAETAKRQSLWSLKKRGHIRADTSDTRIVRLVACQPKRRGPKPGTGKPKVRIVPAASTGVPQTNAPNSIFSFAKAL